MTAPEFLRAAVMTTVDTTVVETRPVPALAPHEVLVEIRAVGVCGSDVHWYRDGRIGSTRVEAPLVLGHEASGVIVAVGADVPDARVGRRVALEPGVPCGRCTQCRAGRYNLCPHVRFFATPPVDGAFATHVALASDFAHDVPDALDDDQAALIEPLAVALWAVRKAGVGIGDRVLVSGAGPVGLLVLQVARDAGAEVCVSDVSEERLAVAADLGASTTMDPRTEPLPADRAVLIECSGAAAAIRAGVAALEPAGRAVLVGMAANGEVTLPLDVLQSREISLTGTFRYANQYPDAIALAAAGRVDLRRLVTSVHPLGAVHDALLLPGRDRSALKPMVHPQQDEMTTA
ncbi:NAD(P)-dependent alcohol dehydrogenase [Microbacterium sp. CSI-V]|uniref:NAD(P)-dependent alcohol dehydrogenase n=1 Tax=unclassified Microbacterium TaxID=2609290 RepID=UPI00097BF9F7|nr:MULTISPECIES: NAD(P)-dependent alcohol dehydrogenase [unclassified Microbacterium]MXS75866.1 NAD(P)-dependent alcohol dehydrogenase [Microbacterium sp. TL13]ONI64971.1 NAD(P)-dependent alcohol dehydrogenase [Microbacterium sp. CSI-V]